MYVVIKKRASYDALIAYKRTSEETRKFVLLALACGTKVQAANKTATVRCFKDIEPPPGFLAVE